CRREGEKLFLKGSRCLSPKCSFERRSYPPGQHGRDAQFRRGRASDYSLQLREKQKARRIYGVLERQFRRYFRDAVKRPGLTGTNLLVILESRLDNTVYRLGLAESRAHARQLVAHGHFSVNGRRTNIPSYVVTPGDKITVREESRKRPYFRDLRQALEGRPPIPEWLELKTAQLEGTALRKPERSDIDLTINEQLIVEFYSR
ncbi:MAG: 30S ribosomal protein S4, partial [Anaerolineae bacterium]|nr:30S ribosomal protein S4 [Anaerolineae bacterium]